MAGLSDAGVKDGLPRKPILFLVQLEQTGDWFFVEFKIQGEPSSKAQLRLFSSMDGMDVHLPACYRLIQDNLMRDPYKISITGGYTVEQPASVPIEGRKEEYLDSTVYSLVMLNRLKWNFPIDAPITEALAKSVRKNIFECAREFLKIHERPEKCPSCRRIFAK